MKRKVLLFQWRQKPSPPSANALAVMPNPKKKMFCRANQKSGLFIHWIAGGYGIPPLYTDIDCNSRILDKNFGFKVGSRKFP